jgi:hypothetical protein
VAVDQHGAGSRADAQTMLMSVVLPAPFGPSSAKISPGRMSSDTFLSAC